MTVIPTKVGIHVFYSPQQRHGWCSFAHHDDPGKTGVCQSQRRLVSQGSNGVPTARAMSNKRFHRDLGSMEFGMPSRPPAGNLSFREGTSKAFHGTSRGIPHREPLVHESLRRHPPRQQDAITPRSGLCVRSANGLPSPTPGSVSANMRQVIADPDYWPPDQGAERAKIQRSRPGLENAFAPGLRKIVLAR